LNPLRGEQALVEHGAKVGDANRCAIEKAMADLKEALKGSDADAITAKTNALAQVSMKLYLTMFRTTRPGVEVDVSKLVVAAAISAARNNHNSAQGKDRNDQARSHAVQRLQVQLIVSLYWNAACRWPLNSFRNCVCVPEVVLVTLTEWLGIGWRYLSHIVTEREQLAGNIVRRHTRLDTD
jgi:hypothetical protein